MFPDVKITDFYEDTILEVGNRNSIRISSDHADDSDGEYVI